MVSTTIFDILVFVAVSIAVAGLFLIRRLTSLNLREEHNAVAGFVYSVLGVARRRGDVAAGSARGRARADGPVTGASAYVDER